MRRKLEQLPIHGEREAAERAWAVVQAAFAEVESRPAPHPHRRTALPILAASLVAAVLAIAVSPAGTSLIRSVRQAVGVRAAAPALVSLPAPGRVLVNSTAGSWIVERDGAKRLLGLYTDSSWSPHGLFEVVVRGRELAAVDPKGTVRWSLERRGQISNARWSPDGYRIAYLAGDSLRVVAGDGTGDRLIARDVRRLAPVWRPGQDHVIAFVDRSGDVRVVDADTGATRGAWHERGARELLWSPDGVVLLGRTATSLDLHAATGARLASIRGEFIAAAWAPGGRTLALVAYDAARDRSDVTIRAAPRGPSRRVFSGTGRIEQVEWSPDSQWLLLPWRTADQWLFAPTRNVGSLRAVASITSQFHSRAFPRLAGWCCG